MLYKFAFSFVLWGVAICTLMTTVVQSSMEGEKHVKVVAPQSVTSEPSFFLEAFNNYIENQLQEVEATAQSAASKKDSNNPPVLLDASKSIRGAGGSRAIELSPLAITQTTGHIRQNFFDDKRRWIGALITSLGVCSVLHFRDEILSFVLTSVLDYGVYTISSTFYDGEDCLGEPNSRFPNFGFVYPRTERKETDSGSTVFVRASYSLDYQEVRRLWGSSSTGFIRSFYRNRNCVGDSSGRIPFHFELKPTELCADYTWDIVPVTYYGQTFCSNEDQLLTYVDFDSIDEPTCAANGNTIETVPLQCFPLIYIPGMQSTVQCITK